MQNIFCLYKKMGETPLETLQSFKRRHLEYANVPLTYVGRLDPMAEGLLLVLAGEENKNREKYLGLPKRYSVEILFGVQTDTHDALGLVTGAQSATIIEKDLKSALETLLGKQLQAYPIFSSKTVLGKPLWQWARQGRIDELEIPKKEIEIFSLRLESFESRSSTDIFAKIEQNISRVNGDLRQSAVISKWREFFKSAPASMHMATVRAECSSGAYMRSLAHLLGEKLGTGAIALYIKREKIGNFSLDMIVE